MSTSALQAPVVGDPVFFEGLPHKIAQLTDKGVEFVSELTHTRVTPVDQEDPSKGSSIETIPRFRTVANRADLQWSSRYKVWYLWGRLLCKSRGGVGDQQRSIVAELRDRGLLAARETRERGQGPAGGEQLGLYYCLFSKPGINWRQEMANVRRGDGLSENAKASCDEFDSEIKCKFGFATPDDGDPVGTKGGN